MRRERLLSVYIFGLFFALLVVWVANWKELSFMRFGQIGVVSGLSLLFEMNFIPLPYNRDIILTMTTPILLALAVSFGGFSAVTMLLLGLPILIFYYRRRSKITVLFNYVELGLGVSISLQCYKFVGGHIGTFNLWHPWPMIVLGLVYFVMNNLFVLVYFLFRGDIPQKLKFTDIYNTEMFAVYFLELVFAIVIAALFPIIGFAGLLLSTLVLWVAGLNYSKLYHALELAAKDDLTGLFNRRHLNKVLEKQLAKPQDGSLLLLDLDGFKRYNDTFGHPQGDRLLRQVSTILLELVGKTGTVFRYGGEEFAVILPRVSSTRAVEIAELIRSTVESYDFERVQELPDCRITVSIGVATFPANPGNMEHVIQLADKCLYKAKSMSKNRVVAHPADC